MAKHFGAREAALLAALPKARVQPRRQGWLERVATPTSPLVPAGPIYCRLLDESCLVTLETFVLRDDSEWNALHPFELRRAHEYAPVSLHTSSIARLFESCCGPPPQGLSSCFETVGSDGAKAVFDAGDEDNLGAWLDAIASVLQPVLLSGGRKSQKLRNERDDGRARLLGVGSTELLSTNSRKSV